MGVFFCDTKRISKLEKKICVLYHICMIAKARDVKRYKQKKLSSLTRGIYSTPEEDLFDVYLYKYKTGVITLETALSFYDLIDEWIETPYCFCFQNIFFQIS